MLNTKLGLSTAGSSGAPRGSTGQRPALGQKPIRKSRNPFSLITLTHLETVDDYQKIDDLKGIEKGSPTKQRDKVSSMWSAQERACSSEDGMSSVRKIDVETGFKNGIDPKW